MTFYGISHIIPHNLVKENEQNCDIHVIKHTHTHKLLELKEH